MDLKKHATAQYQARRGLQKCSWGRRKLSYLHLLHLFLGGCSFRQRCLHLGSLALPACAGT